MKAIKSTDELRKQWAPQLEQALNGDLVCAFAHGDCLMPGFDPSRERWQISFWLKDNGPTTLAKLQDLVLPAQNQGIVFGYFLTRELFEGSADVFPLEYLHMAHRHVDLSGTSPLSAFSPAPPVLRLALERELRGLMIHLRRAYLYALAEPKRFQAFFGDSMAHALPLLYGVAYLLAQRYPAHHAEALQVISDRIAPLPHFTAVLSGHHERSEDGSIAAANNYIVELQNLVKAIDRLEI